MVRILAQPVGRSGAAEGPGTAKETVSGLESAAQNRGKQMSNGNHWIDLDYSDGPEGELDYDAYDQSEFDLDPETEAELQERFNL